MRLYRELSKRGDLMIILILLIHGLLFPQCTSAGNKKSICKKSEKIVTPPAPDLQNRIHWEVCCGDDMQISKNFEHNYVWPMETIEKMY